MSVYRHLMFAIGIAIIPASVAADEYEDKCILSAAQHLPAAAQVVLAETAPASKELVQRSGRDKGIRWVTVTFTVKIGGREMRDEYLCGRVPAGNFLTLLTR